MNTEIITNILNCARCGLNHNKVTFKKLSAPIEDSDGTQWNYWALCPKNKEPVLMKIIEDKR